MVVLARDFSFAPGRVRTMVDENTVLRVEGLTVPLPYGQERYFAVDAIDLTLEKGEILCIVGESGSGKSILASAIMGLLPYYMPASAGRILFNGRDLIPMTEPELRNERGRSIAMIFQEPLTALNPLMPIGQQIAEVLAVHGEGDASKRNARVLELLAYVGLPEPDMVQHAYPFRLSGGQRQRVMIAMALVMEPDVLIADEPTTALDVTTQAQILELIRRIQRDKGMAVLFITHDFGVVADISDRVAVMEKGKIVEQGTTDQVLNRPQHPYTRALISSIPKGIGHSATDMSSRGALLEVDNLQKTFHNGGGLFAKGREVVALDRVSFSLHRGEILGIVGESGSGKSTLGRCVLKLIDADAGRITFDGVDISMLSEDAFRPMRRRAQMVFQDPFSSLNPRHRVGRILMDGPLAHGVGRAEAELRAREMLGLVGLDPASFDRYPHEFSGGQRQRIGIARALVLKPDLLVADEAVSALDASVQAQVLALLQRLQRQLGIAVLFITHDLRIAVELCNRVVVMHRGAIVEQGDCEKVFSSPAHEYTRRLIASIPGISWLPPKLSS